MLKEFIEETVAAFGAEDPTVFHLHLFLIAYFIIGLPIAWIHTRQQKMVEPIKNLHSAKTKQMVFYTLIVVWPLLLLGMVLAYMQHGGSSEKDG